LSASAELLVAIFNNEQLLVWSAMSDISACRRKWNSRRLLTFWCSQRPRAMEWYEVNDFWAAPPRRWVDTGLLLDSNV